MGSKSASSGFKCDDKARQAANIILNGLGTELSKSVSAMNDVQLSEACIEPSDYQSADDFYRDWLAINLMSKYPGLSLGKKTKDVAFTKFGEAEKACTSSNLRLLTPCPEWGVEAVISTARRKIYKLLGDFDWNACEPFFGFSGGASTRFKRRDAQPPNKLSFVKRPHVTSECLPLLKAYLASMEGGIYHSYVSDLGGATEVVPGNRLTTVPKNAKTDRVIAVEPDWNMFFQKGIGGLIRSKLKRVKVNLDDQSWNQELALAGSIDNVLATVDLSAASDSISIGICELLLPPDWFSAILRTRSRCGSLPDGTQVEYQKVSSMGNGFTFELESLIFWALTVSCRSLSEDVTDHRMAIYGDDIVVDRAVIPLLTKVFDFCGFTFNEEKSFVDGPFRESCGKHYFQGCDVTPFYIRKSVTNVFRLFWLVNSFRRWTYRLYGFSPVEYFSTWKKLVILLPKRFRKLSVPEGVGDGGIVRPLSEAKPRYAGYTFQVPVVRGLVKRSELAHHLGYFDALFRSRNVESPTYRWTGVTLVPYKELRNSISSDGGQLRRKSSSAFDVNETSPDEYRIRRYRLAVWDDPPLWMDVRAEPAESFLASAA